MDKYEVVEKLKSLNLNAVIENNIIIVLTENEINKTLTILKNELKKLGYNSSYGVKKIKAQKNENNGT